MPPLIELKRKIESAEDLQSVVKTMKALAAVNIRQFEKAATSVKTYARVVERGLQAVLQNRPGFSATARTAAEVSVGAVVFGTDQGMCGPLNETIVSYALKIAGRMDVEDDRLRLMAVGFRASNRLAEEGRQVQKTFSVPGSVEAVTPLVQNLLFEIEQWLAHESLDRVRLFNCRPRSGATYRPRQVRMLPLDRQWLTELRQTPWPDGRLPWFTMGWDELFAALVRQYLFVSLYRAVVESLAAENTSRLAAMQRAESNIEERLDDFRGRYHRMRQKGITEELLDIVSGFEALRTQDAARG